MIKSIGQRAIFVATLRAKLLETYILFMKKHIFFYKEKFMR